jgi:hypothetical protein
MLQTVGALTLTSEMMVTLCNVTCPRARLGNSAMPAVRGSDEAIPADPSVADRIVDFLDGRTHGEDLFHELYDHVLAEPIPHRMRMLLRNS